MTSHTHTGPRSHYHGGLSGGFGRKNKAFAPRFQPPASPSAIMTAIAPSLVAASTSMSTTTATASSASTWQTFTLPGHSPVDPTSLSDRLFSEGTVQSPKPVARPAPVTRSLEQEVEEDSRVDLERLLLSESEESQAKRENRERLAAQRLARAASGADTQREPKKSGRKPLQAEQRRAMRTQTMQAFKVRHGDRVARMQREYTHVRSVTRYIQRLKKENKVGDPLSVTRAVHVLHTLGPNQGSDFTMCSRTQGNGMERVFLLSLASPTVMLKLLACLWELYPHRQAEQRANVTVFEENGMADDYLLLSMGGLSVQLFSEGARAMHTMEDMGVEAVDPSQWHDQGEETCASEFNIVLRTSSSGTKSWLRLLAKTGFDAHCLRM